MTDLANMAQRHDQILSELAELGVALARDLQARALAATDAGEAADMALAFHRISRSLRQTLALEARLARERRQAASEDRKARIPRSRAAVRRAVEGVIWSEHEGDEAEDLLDELDERLGEAVLAEDFADAPVDAHVARLCADLGLRAAITLLDGEGDGRTLRAGAGPQPLAVAADHDGWRSSA